MNEDMAKLWVMRAHLEGHEIWIMNVLHKHGGWINVNDLRLLSETQQHITTALVTLNKFIKDTPTGQQWIKEP